MVFDWQKSGLQAPTLPGLFLSVQAPLGLDVLVKNKCINSPNVRHFLALTRTGSLVLAAQSSLLDDADAIGNACSHLQPVLWGPCGHLTCHLKSFPGMLEERANQVYLHFLQTFASSPPSSRDNLAPGAQLLVDPLEKISLESTGICFVFFPKGCGAQGLFSSSEGISCPLSEAEERLIF